MTVARVLIFPFIMESPEATGGDFCAQHSTMQSRGWCAALRDDVMMST